MQQIMTVLLATAALLGAASATATDPQITTTSDNATVDQNNPYLYSSSLGDFRVMMPTGCAKVKQLYNEQDQLGDDDPDIEAVQVIAVTCDRFEEQGQGCSVTAFFNLTDGRGGPAGPNEVTRQLRKVLKQMDALVTSEQFISGEFGPGRQGEGVDVRATSGDGVGEVWLRGLLVEGAVYLLSAWDVEGGLWDDPLIQQFFNSFSPGAE
ncbi:MAG: hypothetical protein AB7V45_03595 [Candidatus Krumholzibacteriia bacterium]